MPKVIEYLEQNIRKQIDCKIPSSGNTKLLGNTKHNQVKLVLAVLFFCLFVAIQHLN